MSWEFHIVWRVVTLHTHTDRHVENNTNFRYHNWLYNKLYVLFMCSVKSMQILPTGCSRKMQLWTCFTRRWKRWKPSLVTITRNCRESSRKMPFCWLSRSKTSTHKVYLRLYFTKCQHIWTGSDFYGLAIGVWNARGECRFRKFCAADIYSNCIIS